MYFEMENLSYIIPGVCLQQRSTGDAEKSVSKNWGETCDAVLMLCGSSLVLQGQETEACVTLK